VNERGSASDDRLREFLADSLAMWGVAGYVEAGEAPVVACITTAATGVRIAVERVTDTQSPFRWFVRVLPADASPGSAATRHPRPCTSIVGVLNALRAALGIERAGRARIVPAPATR